MGGIICVLGVVLTIWLVTENVNDHDFSKISKSQENLNITDSLIEIAKQNVDCLDHDEPICVLNCFIDANIADIYDSTDDLCSLDSNKNRKRNKHLLSADSSHAHAMDSINTKTRYSTNNNSIFFHITPNAEPQCQNTEFNKISTNIESDFLREQAKTRKTKTKKEKEKEKRFVNKESIRIRIGSWIATILSILCEWIMGMGVSVWFWSKKLYYFCGYGVTQVWTKLVSFKHKMIGFYNILIHNILSRCVALASLHNLFVFASTVASVQMFGSYALWAVEIFVAGLYLTVMFFWFIAACVVHLLWDNFVIFRCLL